MWSPLSHHISGIESKVSSMMSIQPANETKKPAYPTLLAASAVVAVSTLVTTSCRQQQEPPMFGGVPPFQTIHK